MERVILVSVCLKNQHTNEESLKELRRLAHTAGAEVVNIWRVRVQAFSAAALIGSGKMEEIAQDVRLTQAQAVIFDDEISPAQQKNLEKVIPAKVIDRVGPAEIPLAAFGRAGHRFNAAERRHWPARPRRNEIGIR